MVQGVLATDPPHVTVSMLLAGWVQTTENLAPAVLLFTVTPVTLVEAVRVISNRTGLLTL
jgi:hypothetical protein